MRGILKQVVAHTILVTLDLIVFHYYVKYFLGGIRAFDMSKLLVLGKTSQ